jgi:uncharacterized protein YhhL (DUF1145 family)
VAYLKLSVLVTWLVCLSAFFVPGESSAAAIGRILFGILVAVHLIECVVFLPRFRTAPDSLWSHIGKTMLYGVFHLREVKTAPQENTPGS